MYEYELEGEFEYEAEAECEWEGECEAEEFFGRLAALARRAAQSPALRRVGLAAARTALGGIGNIGAAIGGVPGSPGTVPGPGLPQAEYEGEFEWEGEVNPLRRVYPDALMEHLGHAAAETESEAEAEAFIGALIPLAARIIPRVAPAIMRAAPQLIRGAARVTRTLRRKPATRQLVRTMPTIIRNTAVSIARQASQGRPVTPQTAVRTLAQQTARVISSPRRAVQAYQRSRALDRRHHRVVGPAAAASSRSAAVPATVNRSANGACAACRGAAVAA